LSNDNVYLWVKVNGFERHCIACRTVNFQKPANKETARQYYQRRSAEVGMPYSTWKRRRRMGMACDSI
jgi:hypothetical protein